MQRPVTLPPAPHGHNGLGRRSAVLPVENLGWVKLAASNRALINWAKHYGPTADPEQDARNGATIPLRTWPAGKSVNRSRRPDSDILQNSGGPHGKGRIEIPCRNPTVLGECSVTCNSNGNVSMI